VPENRHDPNSRLIALPVIVIVPIRPFPVSRSSAARRPGITNMEFPDARPFTANHDVVLVGYRGVDGFDPARLPGGTSAMEHSADLLSEQSFRAVAAAYRSCADRSAAWCRSRRLFDPEKIERPSRRPAAPRLHQIDLVTKRGHPTAMIYAWRTRRASIAR